MQKTIALAFADLHLSLKPPACPADNDWMETQAQYLNQIEVQRKALDVPVLMAGDVFDRWNPSPELIHFALEHLPDGMVSVPGQHDLPHHRIDGMKQSGYGVLKRAGKIVDISGRTWINGFIAVQGFGWGQDLKPLPDVIKSKALVHVGLVHRYCWTMGHNYPGAPEGSRAMAYYKTMKEYTVVVFGDNHIPFDHTFSNGTVFSNCGTLIRRRSNEIHQSPSVIAIKEDGSIQRMPLNTKADRFYKDAGSREIKEAESLDLEDFFQGLQGLGEGEFNFRDAVEMELDRRADLNPQVREIIEGILKNI